MTKNTEVYKCEHCGNVVEVLHPAGGKLVCCGEPMVLQNEKTADSATEKHVPIVEKIENGYKVTVGSTLHPMVDDHYIEWIELIADGISYRKYLEPGNEPVGTFEVEAKEITCREYCNKHGLWKNN